ncbi:MAG: hypothetical protein QM778_16035 [Myxococcales bacterium]
MKGQGWLAAGLGLSLAIGGCSGSDDDEQSVDVSADAGVQDFSDDIKGLRDQIDGLTPQFAALDGRLDALETPPPAHSCSTGELCIPDGIALASSAFQPIITAVCKKMTDCCEVRELFWLYGKAIQNEADCEATLKDLINNGQANYDYYYQGALGNYVQMVVEAGHALNDTDVLVEVNTASVTACAAEIDAEVCYRDQTYPERCSYESDTSPCDLSQLFTGKERAGDTCNFGSAIQECGAGLVCRDAKGTSPNRTPPPQSGLCAAKAAAGQRCISDEDCDDLYCDHGTGTCKVAAKEGEPCTFVDPTFLDIDIIDGEVLVVPPTIIDCEQGLACNPVTNTCAKDHCAAGSWCRGNYDCPAGHVCTNSGSQVLADASESQGYLGVCTPGLADGATCAVDTFNRNDCANFACSDPDDDGTNTCQPAPVACDYGCYGSDCRTCAAGSYCHNQSSTCEPLIENGLGCFDDTACKSGFCNEGTCEPRVAAGGSCPTGSNQQCPDGQYCNDGTCAPAVGLGELCDLPGSDSNCSQGLRCLDVDGPDGAGSVYRCYTFHKNRNEYANLPDGVYCADVDYDHWCTSGFCRKDGTNYACAATLGAGAECVPTNQDTYRCSSDLGCIVNQASTLGGYCGQWKLPGEVCDPDLNECRGNEYYCQLHGDNWLCSPYSGSEEFCIPIGGG